MRSKRRRRSNNKGTAVRDDGMRTRCGRERGRKRELMEKKEGGK